MKRKRGLSPFSRLHRKFHCRRLIACRNRAKTAHLDGRCKRDAEGRGKSGVVVRLGIKRVMMTAYDSSGQNVPRSSLHLGIYRMRLPAFVLSMVLSIGCLPACSAGITLIDSQVPFFDINGVITKSDLADLERTVEVMRSTKGTPMFRLNSEGGDVETAIAIGRQLRRFQAHAITYSQGRCLSACVLILAGAVRRDLSDNIGIHRPFSTGTDQKNFETVQSAQRRLTKLVKDYLEEMNVSPSLYDAMQSVPPETMRVLSPGELAQYGLIEVDPVQQELEDSAEARKYKLAKIEYLKRKSQVQMKCSKYLRSNSTENEISTYLSCRENVIRSNQ